MGLKTGRPTIREPEPMHAEPILPTAEFCKGESSARVGVVVKKLSGESWRMAD